jgi:hypothetical protein
LTFQTPIDYCRPHCVHEIFNRKRSHGLIPQTH